MRAEESGVRDFLLLLAAERKETIGGRTADQDRV
jgi:hypothetical protein